MLLIFFVCIFQKKKINISLKKKKKGEVLFRFFLSLFTTPQKIYERSL